MKKILLSLVLLTSTLGAVDLSKMNKQELVTRIIKQERKLSESLTALNERITREKNLIDGIDAQIDSVFEK